MKTILIITIIMLTGCEQYCGSCRDTTDFDYEDIETGLTVKDYTESGEILDIGQFVRIWNAVQGCTGLSALPGPYIAIVEDGSLSPDKGLFHPRDKVIEIEVNEINNWLGHEMIHYLLQYNGETDEKNRSHDSIHFTRCKNG